MLFVWLNRILFALFVAIGVLFSFENRQPLTFTVAGTDYTTKVYLVLIGAVAIGFTIGVVLSALNTKAKQVKKLMSKNQ